MAFDVMWPTETGLATPQRGVHDQEPGLLLARGLLTFVFFVYLVVVLASAAALAPLSSRAAAASVLLLGAVAAVALTWRTRPRAARHAPAMGESDRAFTVLGTAAAALGGAAMTYAAALALLLPIGAYDALGYRLPAIAQWLDAGAVIWVAGDDPLRNGYPLGLEVVGAAFFRAFDSPAPVDALSVLCVIAGAAALAGFARLCGAGSGPARLAAGLFMLAPVHLLNAPSGYVDAAFSGCLVALFVAVARWTAPGRAGSAPGLDAGIAAALVTALKPHGFAFAGLALATGLWLRARALGLGRAGREFIAIAALASPGLFFAARNVVRTGNPLYPLELRLGEHVLLRGESSLEGILTPAFNVPRELAALPAWLRPLWVWLQPHGPAQSFDDRWAGFGYAFAVLGVPALTWALFRRELRAALGVVLGLSFACWLLQPLSFWPRFSSWLWGAAGLAIALGIGELARHGRARAAQLVLASALLLALPEATYALAHVKALDRLGLVSVLRVDPVTALARVAGVDAGFVRRALVGKSDVCRTPWTLGTDDANLDGVVAQLSPRPRMHVIDEAHWSSRLDAARARGCDQLIAIGDAAPLASAPAGFAGVQPATAFGPCRLVPVPLAEVMP